MRDISGSTHRRAQSVTAVGLLVQLFALGVLLALAVWSGAQSLRAASAHVLGGVPIWLVLLLVCTQRKRAEMKDRELEELRQARAADPAAAIFELEEGSIERRRLAWMYRWMFPIATLILAAYHVVCALFVPWSWKLGEPLGSAVWTEVAHPGPIMALLAGVGFACFLYSRYAGGMAHQREWRIVRAGASYLTGNALTCLAVIVAVGLQTYDVPYGEPIVAHGIRILMLLIGVEFIIALVLNYYRPRVAGEELRPSFDSRLLEMVSEPGGVARSIAEAINYQFGFEVTKTWFAQLLKRSFFPLLVLGVLVLLLLSSIVIIDADEQAFVEHFGRLVQTPDQALGPGLYLKWPWPIDRVFRAPVTDLQQMTVGAEPTDSPYDEEGRLKPILWTETHTFTYEMLTVVANPTETETRAPTVELAEEEGGGELDKSVAVALIYMSVPVEYRIKNLHEYLYNYERPEKVLEDIAFQALSDYAAGIRMDDLMAAGRTRFNERFQKIIQDRADELELGIEITFLALQDAHPPATENVAKSFQDVITAEMRKNGDIENARGQAQRALTEVVGSVERAHALDAAIRARDELQKDSATTEELRAAAQAAVDELMLGNPAKWLAPMSGEAAKIIAEANAERTDDLSEAESKARVFDAELAAFQTAPTLYKVRKYLDMLVESVQAIRKYVVTLDTQKTKLLVIIESERKSVVDIGEEPEEAR